MTLLLPISLQRLAKSAMCLSAVFAAHHAAHAGDVSISKVGGTLHIIGGNFNNSVSIVGSNDEDGTVGVYPEGSDSPQIYENVTNIMADLGDGHDTLAMDGLHIDGDIDVDAGTGNNFVYLGGWGHAENTIGGDVIVTAAGGNDYVGIAYAWVSGSVDVQLGGGDNVVEMGFAAGPGIDPGYNAISNDLTILTGEDQDYVHIVETIVWGQGLIETNGDNDDVRLGPVQIAMLKAKRLEEEPNDLKTREASPNRSESASDLKSSEPAPDQGGDRTASDFGFKLGESNGVPATNSFSDLTINAGSGHDFVGLEKTAVSGTALIQMWYGNDDLYLVDYNYFYGTMTAQGGPGTDMLVESATNFYSNPPTYMGFE